MDALPPGLAGYYATQEATQRSNLSGLQQATGLAGLLAHIQEQQELQKIRSILSSGEQDPQKMISAMAALGPRGAFMAHHIVAAMQGAETLKQNQAMGAMQPGDPRLQDPEFWQRQGIRLGKPEYLTHAERLKKAQDAKEEFGLSKSIPGQPMIPALTTEGLPSGVLQPIQEATPGKPGLFADLMQSKYPHIANQAKMLQMQLDRSGGSEATLKYMRDMQSHLAARESGYLQAESMAASGQERKIDFRMQFPPQPSAPHLIYRKEPDGTTTAIDFATGKEMKNVTPPGGVTADIRLDRTWATQRQTQLNRVTELPQRNLLQIGMYDDARATGDNAQAALVAANALRQSSRSGDRTLKGEVDRLLGSGYGSGNLYERVENFISQDLNPKGGAPSNNTLAKVDKLIRASEHANLGQIAMQLQNYANQAHARGIPVANVAVPYIRGRNVALTTGEVATFPTPQKAQEYVDTWMSENR